jgi:DNA (cytosine-5)-methyltransferase 1
MTRPRCLELFAGAGGAAFGIEAAGFEHAALVEVDPDACATLRRIWHDAVVETDVRDLDTIEAAVERIAAERAYQTASDVVDELQTVSTPHDYCAALEHETTRHYSTDIDLLWSSFPCQAWSNAGARRGADDERNGWPWTVDAIDRFRPLVFIGENVRGLLSFPYFEEVILPDLRQRFAHVGYWLLDAADYGVPQHRRRVFVWGAPARCLPPPRTHGPGMFTRPWVSMAEALQLDGRRIIGGGRNPQAAGIERTYRDITDEPSTCVTAVQVGNAGPWLLDKPSTTICGADGHGLSCAAVRDRLQSAIGRRRLTVDECATLQGFPHGYASSVMVGTARSRYRQVGNAVPPALAEAVVRAICPVCV